MTKLELLKKISESTDITQKDVNTVLSVLETVIIEAVKNNDYVVLPGIGKISVKNVPERTGIIQMGDRKGETYTVATHKEPKMKLLKPFKDCLL